MDEISVESRNNFIKRLNLDYQHTKLIEFFINNKIYSYKIVEANPEYYNLSLSKRMSILGSSSIEVLCKTIILENTAFEKEHESKYYKQFYLAIVQYTNEFNGEKIAKELKKIQNNSCEDNKLSKKYFHIRLAKSEIAFDLSGYLFNCITPFMMKTENLQILFPKNLTEIYPQYFWLGGGEIELKVGIRIDDFIKLYEDRTIILDLSSK